MRRVALISLCILLAGAAALVAAGCGGGSGIRGDDTFRNPTAVIAASTTLVKEGVLVSFDASGSSDYEDVIGDLQFAWDFGDTSTGAGMNVSHAFAAAGTYTVKLTVTDTDTRTGTATVVITVTAAAAAPVARVEAVTLKGNLSDAVAIADHVDVTVTPPGTTEEAAVDGGTGDFSYQVVVGTQDLTVDVVGADTSSNTDAEQLLIEP